MKLIAVYDDITKKYIEKQVAQLIELGYSIEMLYHTEATDKYGIKYFPSFSIAKNNKVGYTLGGKQNFTQVLRWVQDSGLECK